MLRSFARVVLFFSIPILTGCGGGDNTTTVKGKITYNGVPVTHGLINFSASQGQPLGGSINSDGTYQFDLPEGDYKVRIDAPPKLPEGLKEGDPLPKEGPRLLPANYADYETSGLTATVTSDSPQQLDFALP